MSLYIWLYLFLLLYRGILPDSMFPEQEPEFLDRLRKIHWDMTPIGKWHQFNDFENLREQAYALDISANYANLKVTLPKHLRCRGLWEKLAAWARLLRKVFCATWRLPWTRTWLIQHKTCLILWSNCFVPGICPRRLVINVKILCFPKSESNVFHPIKGIHQIWWPLWQSSNLSLTTSSGIWRVGQRSRTELCALLDCLCSLPFSPLYLVRFLCERLPPVRPTSDTVSAWSSHCFGVQNSRRPTDTNCNICATAMLLRFKLRCDSFKKLVQRMQQKWVMLDDAMAPCNDLACRTQLQFWSMCMILYMYMCVFHGLVAKEQVHFKKQKVISLVLSRRIYFIMYAHCL